MATAYLTPGVYVEEVDRGTKPIEGVGTAVEQRRHGDAAVLAHRIGVLNKKFPCRENLLAITKIEEASLWLGKRTADRIARGVEGEHKA